MLGVEAAPSSAKQVGAGVFEADMSVEPGSGKGCAFPYLTSRL